MLKNTYFFIIYRFVYFRVFCLIEGKEMEENISMLHQVGLYVPQNLQMIIRRSTFFFLNYKYFQIRILTDMQKKVLSAIFFTKIHFHAEMSFNVSQLIHMNGSCAMCRQSTFSRGVLMFCS